MLFEELLCAPSDVVLTTVPDPDEPKLAARWDVVIEHICNDIFRIHLAIRRFNRRTFGELIRNSYMKLGHMLSCRAQ